MTRNKMTLKITLQELKIKLKLKLEERRKEVFLT